MLSRWADAYARQIGQDVARVRRWISFMALGRPGWRNDRFKDLVDLLLIEELIQDHDALRRACVDLFALRNTHPWPPFVEAPGSRVEPFRRMAVEVDLPVTDVNEAAFRIRRLLNDR